VRTHHKFSKIKKNFGFLKIYSVSARTCEEGGLSQCGHFANKGRGGQFFVIFVRKSFMDGLLAVKQFDLLKTKGSRNAIRVVLNCGGA